MDFVIKQHMLLKRRETDSSCASGSRGRLWLWQAAEIRARGTEMDAALTRRCGPPYMNFQSNECSYSLTSCVSFTLPFTNRCWTGSKSVSSVYSRFYRAPFHFLSQGPKSTDLWSAAHALNNSWHWLVSFFPPSLCSLSAFFPLSVPGCAVGGFYSFSSFIKASPHLLVR